jgi:predicted DNA binding CopG/RHH family protein
MRKIKLTKYEQSIEDAIGRGEGKPVSKEEDESIRLTLANYRKNAVLHMRINNNDLSLIKSKAKKLGLKYQSFIAEFLHKIAHS